MGSYCGPPFLKSSLPLVTGFFILWLKNRKVVFMEGTQNKIILILGRKGMGKTTQAWRMLEEMGVHRWLFIDPQGQLRRNGLYFGDEHFKEFPRREFSQFIQGRRENLVVHMPLDEYDKLFAVLARMVKAGVDLNFWMIVDEPQLFMDANFLPEDIRMLLAIGRQSRLSQIYIVREAQEIPKFMRGQADMILSFQQVEPASLEWSGKLASEAREVLPKLRRWEYVYLREDFS